MKIKRFPLILLLISIVVLNSIGQEGIQYSNWSLADIVYDFVGAQDYETFIIGGPEIKQLDTSGGELLFFITPKNNMECRQTYRVGWTFDTTLNKLQEEQTIGIRVFNDPEDGLIDCYQEAREQSDANSYLTISFKGGVQIELNKNPDFSWYWGEGSQDLFGLNNSNGIEVYPVSTGGETLNGYASESIFVKDGGEEVGTTNAPFGTLAFEIGKKDVFSFQILYLFFGEEAEISPEGAHVLRIDKPFVEHNIASNQDDPMMNIVLPGLIDDAVGRDLEITMRFMDGYGRLMEAYPGDSVYSDQNGYAVSSSPLVKVTDKRFDLQQIIIHIPYYALNLTKTGTKAHVVFVIAEVYLDGKSIGVSKPTQTTIVW